MEKKILGVILASMGMGMLMVIFLPWWGFLVAAIMVVAGGILIFNK